MKKFSSTTKGSYRRTSKTSTISRTILVGVFLVAILWLAPRLVATVASSVFVPIHVVENWLWNSSNSLPQFFRDRTALVAEINELKNEPPEGVSAEIAIRRLTTENEELRSLLNDTSDERILAGVIGRPSVTPYDVLVIDKGVTDGIVTGAPVYIDSATVIGSVVQVNQHSAVVELITTAQYSSTVYIYGPNIYTTAEGIGGGVLRVSVPQGILLEEGNLVVLPSASPGVYGEITLVESVPTQPEQYGYVQSEIPLQQLHYVAVGTRSLDGIDFEQAQANVRATIDSVFTVPVPDDVLIDVFATTSTSTIASTSLPVELSSDSE